MCSINILLQFTIGGKVMRKKPELESSKLTLKERFIKLFGLKERPEVVQRCELNKLDVIKFVGLKFYIESAILPRISNHFLKNEH